MQRTKFEGYLDSLKQIGHLSQGVGALLPALSYFINLAPPWFEETALITTGLAVAVIVITHYYLPPPSLSRHETSVPPRLRLAWRSLLLSLVMLVLYLILLRWCSVLDPRNEQRFQIGFGRWDFGLTEDGREIKKNYPAESVTYWMLASANFRPGGPEIIWKTWTILTAGVLEIVLFILTFLSWTFAWALIGKQLSEDRAMTTTGGEANPSAG